MKTKVRMSPSLLAYRQQMAQLANDLRDEKLRIAASAEHDMEPFACQMDIPGSDKAGLLIPSRIEILLPEFYLTEGGEIEGVININTSDYFGIASLGVTIRDEMRNLLESGEAMLDKTCLGLWTYLPRIVPVVDTSLIIRALAIDTMGGLSLAEETLTLSEEYLRASSDSLESGK